MTDSSVRSARLIRAGRANAQRPASPDNAAVTLNPLRFRYQWPATDHDELTSIARIGLSMTTFANRIDSVGDSRSKYHHAFHHPGITMIASPRSTA
jgi:hypothetical protein